MPDEPSMMSQLDTLAGNPAPPADPIPDKPPTQEPDPKPETNTNTPAPEKAPAPPKSAAPAKAPAPAKTTAPAKAPAPAPAKAPTKAPEVVTELPEDLTTVAPKALREAYTGLKGKYKQLESKLAEASKAPKLGDDHPEIQSVKKEAENYKKRVSELEDHIRYVDYSRSEEYKTKYHQPYVDASKSATAEVSELSIPQADGTSRASTADDFWSIVQIPNAEKALEAAEKLYGTPTKANFVMQQRQKVREAYARAENAKEEYRTKGAEREKTTLAEREKASREGAARWKASNEKLIADQPELYGPEEGDDEGNALLEKGFERYDAAFGGEITDPDTGEKRRPNSEELIEISSELRTKAAAFDRLQHRNTRLLAQIAELQEQVKQYETSGPGGGAPPGGEKKTDEDSVDSAIDKMASMNK